MFNCNNLFNILFADNTTALTKGKNIEDLSNLQKLCTWLRSNKLAVNTDKTKIMIFHPKGKRVPDNVVFSVNNNDIGSSNIPELFYPIERISNTTKISAFKILGVYLDENLSLFDYHFKHLYSKISKSLYYLNNAKHFLPTVALIFLYYTLIHPLILYCLPINSCTSQKNLIC